MNEIPHQLIDSCVAHLNNLYERRQPENFVHFLHQLIRDYDLWKSANSRPSSTILEAIIDQKRLCKRYNAEYCSVIMGRMPEIDGWDARLTVAAPGVLNKGDSDE